MSFTPTFGSGTVTAANNTFADVTLSATTQFQWPRFNYNTTSTIADIMRVTAGSGLSLYMPDATLVGVGTTVLFINPGANTFTVKDYAGANTLTTVPTSQAIYLILRDNATQVGTWTAIQFAVGSSAVVASALAGLGLTAIGSTLNVNWPRADVSTTPHTVDATTERATLLNWTAGAGVFNLPAVAAGNTGFFFGVKNSGSGSLTITPNGADTINGAASFVVGVGESYLVISGGSAQWFTIGNQLIFTATYLEIDVSGSGAYTVPVTAQGYLIYNFVGTLTGTRTITFPAAVNQFYWYNGTSGAYSLLVATTAAGGATITILQTERVVGYSDGTNMYEIIESGIDTDAFLAISGAITATLTTGTTSMTDKRRYRITGTATGTLPTMVAGSFVIVEYALSNGTTGTVARNSQTIDGAAANDTYIGDGSNYPAVMYSYSSAGVVTSRLIQGGPV